MSIFRLSERAKNGGGEGEEIFCPRAEAKPRRPALWARKPKQKNFLFLLEKTCLRKIKNVEKIFLRGLAAVIGGERRGGAIGFFQEFLIK